MQFELWLLDCGPNKIAVIKELRTITGLGLKEAKDLAEAGGLVRRIGDEVQAEQELEQVRRAGASVEIRPWFTHRWFCYEPQLGTAQVLTRVALAEQTVEVRRMRFGEKGAHELMRAPTIEAAQELAVLHVARLRARGWEIANRELDAFLQLARRDDALESARDDDGCQVYADWLLENGDPRGELISMDLAAAQLDEWWSKNCFAVLGPIARIQPRMRVRWSRGWIDQLELEPPIAMSYDEIAEAMARLPVFERLRALRCTGMMSSSLARFGLPATCSELRLEDDSYYRVDVEAIGVLARKLSLLEFSGFWMPPLPIRSTTLETLIIGSSDLDRVVPRLDPADVPRLAHLHLRRTELPWAAEESSQDDWMELLERPFRAVTQLTLENLEIDLRAILRRPLVRKLATLRLMGSSVTPAVRAELARDPPAMEVRLG